MNELLEQFLLECRELVASGSDDLLALERTPDDPAAIDRAFRAFHTLKGSAGIVAFDAMGTALHSAEDLLAAVRDRRVEASREIIDAALGCLDQVGRWLDDIERSGAVPVDGEAAAGDIAARLRRAGKIDVAPAAAGSERADWVQAFLAADASAARALAEATAPLVALRYEPRPGCFFDGDDPLALVAAAPGLLAVRVSPRRPWPPADALDPFECNLVVEALSGATLAEVTAPFRLVRDQVRFVELAASAVPSRRTPGRSALTLELLVEQRLLLLAGDDPEAREGRIGSAYRSAANALRAEGDDAGAGRLEAAYAAALAADDPEPLIAALSDMLDAPAPPADAPTQAPAGEPAVVRALRVDVEKIDGLVDRLAELVVAKNSLSQLVELAEAGVDHRLIARTAREQQAAMDRVVGDLHQAVMSVRMLPLDSLFRRFARPVREIAASLGKLATLATEGQQTEADKAIVEALHEPLLHLLRNAIDHGIESPDERRQGGKAQAGVLSLRAFRDGERLIVQVADDGRGIDPETVRRVAQARGLAVPDEIDLDKAVELIFSPGFSTATEVTGLSGRGVGMDAVRTAVERLGGRVTVTSRRHVGTTVQLALPLTMVMTSVMLVTVDGETYGVPLDAVEETARVPRSAIGVIQTTQAFVLRDRTVPLVQLGGLLHAPARPAPPENDACIVLTKAGGELMGLEVDGLGDRLEVMLRPLEGILSNTASVAGTSLLGDGRVLLVLDLEQVLA